MSRGSGGGTRPVMEPDVRLGQQSPPVRVFLRSSLPDRGREETVGNQGWCVVKKVV